MMRLGAVNNKYNWDEQNPAAWISGQQLAVPCGFELQHHWCGEPPRKYVPPHPDKEAQVNAQNVNGASPLHIAVMIQNINLAKLLLKYGANVNIRVPLFWPRNTTTSDKKHPCTTQSKKITTKWPHYSSKTGLARSLVTRGDSPPSTMPHVSDLRRSSNCYLPRELISTWEMVTGSTLPTGLKWTSMPRLWIW